jgi:hypothetical protein
MAISSTYLSNPAITINSVDLTDQCTSVVLNYVSEQLENTTFSNTSRSFTSGLFSNTVVVSMYQSYAAAETEASIYSLVGTTTTIVISPTAAGLVTPSATAPKYTLTGTFLSAHTPINASLGELSTIDLTFSGGVLAKAVA